jgi:SAM-dependent methyltransferase
VNHPIHRASSWRDHDDRPVEVPAVPGPDAPAFYTTIGELQGADYRRNAFTAGTDEEIAVLRGLTQVSAGSRVLDVGCADGRHLRALAADVPGVYPVGVDVSPALLEAGRRAARTEDVEVVFLDGDARELTAVLGERVGTFDVAWSLCQGALGTSPVTDPVVLAGMAEALRPGGTLIATFFHALFAARHLVAGDAFDTVDLVHHQRTEVRGPDHARTEVDLWTASYTVRDVRRLAMDLGLEVLDVRGVEPGAYGRRDPGEVALNDPELLLVARHP